MARLFAFLRAVNVGGRTVKMAALARVFEGAGFGGVETFIASGNVVFETGARASGAMERKIEAALEGALGYGVRVFVRTGAEVRAAVEGDPFARERARGSSAGTGAKVHVGFFGKEARAAEVKAVRAMGGAGDRFEVVGREVYWLRMGNLSESEFDGGDVERALGQAATFRTMRTVERMVERFG